MSSTSPQDQASGSSFVHVRQSLVALTTSFRQRGHMALPACARVACRMLWQRAYMA
jgi:hypothetical protein